MRRRLGTLAGPLATATLALGTAAWAAAGDVPLATGDRLSALAVGAQATGPLVSNDQDGSAIFSAGALVPGQVETGEVTIGNAGDVAGAFTLSASGASGPLAGVLDLSGRRRDRFGDHVRRQARHVHAREPRDLRARRVAPLPLRARLPERAGGRRQRASGRDDLRPVRLGRGRERRRRGPQPDAGARNAHAGGPGAGRGGPADTRGPGAGDAAPATTAPIPSVAALTVSLGTTAKPVAKGRLITWMSSSTPATARVTGTVSFSGKRATLPAATVKLTAKRRTVRLKLPAAAVKTSAKRLTVRLTIAATAGGRKTTVKRTLRVTAP